MKPALSQDAAAVFDPLRPLLIRVAYRMLGSVADAEGACCGIEWERAAYQNDVAPAIIVNSPHATLGPRLGRRTALTLPLLPPPQKN